MRDQTLVHDLQELGDTIKTCQEDVLSLRGWLWDHLCLVPPLVSKFVSKTFANATLNIWKFGAP